MKNISKFATEGMSTDLVTKIAPPLKHKNAKRRDRSKTVKNVCD